ncbi:dorsal-ventral patterning tolloid-like protein 1 isoform X2 [Montipora foliosa]|uniref:dorsal-ventral patterning tolloid-like protein 1 isoform X2 n=1 Tax=Montipora foliosa TaxID=591990 RepID=UPI0035F188AC
MAWIERIAFVSIVIAIFLEEGFCDDICPNGITNITGQTSGELEYPMAGTYGVNETKCWRIEIPKPYYRIGIILHRFEFEECLRCECDAVNFESDYSLLRYERVCARRSTSYLDFQTRQVGSRLHQTHIGENFYIRLKSDDSFNYRGFKFSYIVGSDAGGEQSYLNVSEGEINTPKFGSKNYPANFEWQWFLLAPEGHQIKITFSDQFELEQSEYCKNDYLEVREAYFNELINLVRGRYGAILARPTCGTNKPQDMLSAGNMVWVHFKSDSNSTTTYKGFKATFTTSGQCRSFLVNNASTVLLLLASMTFTKIFV